MTTHASAPHPKRKWYGLALRQLRMASRMLGAGFHDGAFFYSYHAFDNSTGKFENLLEKLGKKLSNRNWESSVRRLLDGARRFFALAIRGNSCAHA